MESQRTVLCMTEMSLGGCSGRTMADLLASFYVISRLARTRGSSVDGPPILSTIFVAKVFLAETAMRLQLHQYDRNILHRPKT